VSGALLRYRVIAWIVGVLLIVLFCVGLPLQYAAGHKSVDAVVGVVHGVVFYPLYLILTLDLARRVKMSPIRTLLTMAAGTVPFVSFVAERATTQWVRDRPEAPVLQDRGEL
jgi:integral membrane protein